MILMWLGSFVLALFGLAYSQKLTDQFSHKLQKNIFARSLEGAFPSMLQKVVALCLLQVSPQRSLYSALGVYNLRILAVRPSILMMCLSTLGAWWVLFLGLIYLNFNGYFLLGLSSLYLISFLRTPRMSVFLKWLFAIGTFLIAGEQLLKQSALMQNSLAQGDLIFFLADGRFVSVVTILMASLIISLFIRVEFWSFLLALSLLFAGFISFNGAMALVAGERLGRMALFWFSSRRLNQDCRRIGWQFALTSAFGTVVGLLLAGELRSLIIWSVPLGASQIQEKGAQFVLLFLVILGFQWLAQMVWGHFACQVAVDELQEAKYFPQSWLKDEVLSPVSYDWMKEKVAKRLSEIKYHLQGMNTLKEGQVPVALQTRLKAEEEQLQRFLHDSP